MVKVNVTGVGDNWKVSLEQNGKETLLMDRIRSKTEAVKCALEVQEKLKNEHRN